MDRVLHLTSKLESDIYHIVLIKSKLTQISEKLIEANANDLSVDLTIVSDIRLLEQKICESGINPVLKYIESCADAFLALRFLLQLKIYSLWFWKVICMKFKGFLFGVCVIYIKVFQV